MFERWKKRHTLVDDVNIITKLILGVLLFIFIIFVHNFDYMIYITLLMFIFLLSFNGTAFKVIVHFYSNHSLCLAIIIIHDFIW